jgi:hypothetical protein
MPRPARSDVPANDAIRVRVTKAERRDLEQVARDNRTNMAGVIRDAVNTYVSDYRDRRVFRGPK